MFYLITNVQIEWHHYDCTLDISLLARSSGSSMLYMIVEIIFI